MAIRRKSPHQGSDGNAAPFAATPGEQLLPRRASLWWEDGLPLEALVSLPVNALAGPCPRTKSQALSLLHALVECTCSDEKLDLRRIDGLCGKPVDAQRQDDLQQYADSPACRAQRLIGYRDFLCALGRALPPRAEDTRTCLRQADWRSKQRYWAAHDVQAAASVVVYARRRGLSIPLQARLERYRLKPLALAELAHAFRTQALPREALRQPALARRLLALGNDYASLTLDGQTWTLLLLTQQSTAAQTLAEELQTGGAVDLAAHLAALSRRS